MEKAKIYLKNFIGTSYEVGTQIGEWILSAPDLLQRALLPPNSYPHDKFVQIDNLLDNYCSGINDEIKGFSDTVGVDTKQIIFYEMTYLE